MQQREDQATLLPCNSTYKGNLETIHKLLDPFLTSDLSEKLLSDISDYWHFNNNTNNHYLMITIMEKREEERGEDEGKWRMMGIEAAACSYSQTIVTTTTDTTNYLLNSIY